MSKVFPIVDVTNWPREVTEQMGMKRNAWCRNVADSPEDDLWLFKTGRSHAGEDWSEKIASEIAELLGLPHARIELAVSDQMLGVVAKDFTQAQQRGKLVHGNELLLQADPAYATDGPNCRVAQHTLNRIFDVLGQDFIHPFDGFPMPPGVVSAADQFVGYLMLDALIGNTDRHHANWAILEDSTDRLERRAELAPTYDHASSLGRELTDHRRQLKLENISRRDQTIVGYLISDAGRSRIFDAESDKKALRPMEVFQAAERRYPVGADAWLNRLASIPLESYSEVVDRVPEHRMSQPARTFALRLIELTRTALLSRKFQYD